MKTENEMLADLGFAPETLPSEATAALPPVSLPVLAETLSLSVRAVNQLAVAGVMVKLGRGRYDLAASCRNYIATLRKPDGGSKERLTAAQADLAELKLQESRAALLPASTVEREWAGILRDVRAGCLAVTARVQQHLPHLTAHDAATLDSEIRAALSQLGESQDA
jgi:terminase small subunit / prophage DNA-packing protein